MDDVRLCSGVDGFLLTLPADGDDDGRPGCSAEAMRFLHRHGRRPRVLVLKMGGRCGDSEIAVRRVSSCLADMGFDVDVAPAGLEIDCAVAMAVENDDHFILVIPSAGRGAEIGHELKARLDALKCPHIQVVPADSDLLQDLPEGDQGRVGRESLAARLAGVFDPRLRRTDAEIYPGKYYVQGLLEGNRRVLAQVISLLESHFSGHRELAEDIVKQVLPRTGSALRIGVSGVPGVGKSTFIDRFAARLVGRGYRVAVLAVDPSSLKSGGSIMGDKTRMPGLCRLPEAFIRPSPSGGTLGGVSARTRESMTVCEAAGFDVVLVETVGVGQSETKVASMVDFFLVLMLAGAGDEIQGIKKGILELADAVAVNKADGDNTVRAEEARKDYESALSLLLTPCAGWRPVVLTCSARTGKGLDEIWETVCRHRTALQASGELSKKRRRQSVDWMWDLVREGLRERFYSNPRASRQIRQTTERVAAGRCLPTEAALELLALMDA